MELSNSEVYKRTINSSLWMTASILIQRVLGIVSFLILSRVILPEAYGIMASVTIVIGFLNTISQTGFEAALIQSKDEITSYLNKVWTLNILKSIGLFLIIWFVAPFAGKFFNIEEYVDVIRFSGLFVMLEGLSNIGHIYFSKDINFKMVFFRDLGMPISYIIIALIAVQFISPVWALASATFASYVWATSATYFLSPYRPRFDFNFQKLKKLFNYSSWVIASNLANYINSVIDSTFLAHLLGPGQLGIYSKARDFSVIPSSYISQIASKIGFASISKVQADKASVKNALMKLFDITMLISLPFLALVFTQANNLISLVLKAEWSDIVFPLKFLMIAMTIRGFIIITYPIFNGMGKPKIYFNSILIQIISVFIGLWFMVPKYGISGAAYAIIISTSLCFIYTTFNVVKLTGLKLRTLIPCTFAVSVATLVAGILSVMYNRFIGFGNVPEYIIAMIGIGVIYNAIIFMMWKSFKIGPGDTLKSILQNLI